MLRKPRTRRSAGAVEVGIEVQHRIVQSIDRLLQDV